jgi:hypothetical protein
MSLRPFTPVPDEIFNEVRFFLFRSPNDYNALNLHVPLIQISQAAGYDFNNNVDYYCPDSTVCGDLPASG